MTESIYTTELEPTDIAGVDGQRIEIFDGLGGEGGTFLHDLATAILDVRAMFPSSSGSRNRGGWKSRTDLFAWSAKYAHTTGGAAIRQIADAIAHGFLGGKHPTESWAMINERGSTHLWHTHRGARLTGIYYVTTGDDHAPTVFGMADHPVPGTRPRQGPSGLEVDLVPLIRIDPIPGRLILFPGTTWHSVLPVESETPRITIAFDIRG